jgi:hypothetical protein
MGSDYPVGDADPVGFVERCPSLGVGETRLIAGGTAAKLLGLTAATDTLGITDTSSPAAL